MFDQILWSDFRFRSQIKLGRGIFVYYNLKKGYGFHKAGRKSAPPKI